MGLKLVSGNYFGLNQEDNEDVIINEKAVHALGFQSADDAVGRLVQVADSSVCTIRGVVKDFYHQGYGDPITPLLFRNNSSKCKYMVIEIDKSAKGNVVGQLRQKWKKLRQSQQLNFYFFDEKLEEWNDQSAEISLLGFLGFMTVTIASMGMLGLVVYTMETRRKEISIRKVIGASTYHVISLLSSGFFTILIIAAIIALPSGYLASELFLMGFVNRTPFGIVDLLVCFGFVLFIAFIIILPEAYKVCLENPTKNLKND